MREVSYVRERWRDLWARLGVTDKDWIRNRYSKLYWRYAEPHRHYHTLEHIEYGLRLLDEYRYLARDFDAMEVAWFYHDVIYDTSEKKAAMSNEALSASYAERVLSNKGFLLSFRERVRRLIFVTFDRRNATRRDQMLFIDIDWSVVGLSWEEYRGYVARVRKEYVGYTDKEFLVGRVGWLVSAQKRRLFFTAAFRDRYETLARENMSRELALYERADFAEFLELP